MVDAQQDSVPSSPIEAKDVLERKDKAKKSGSNDRSAASRVDIDVPLTRLHELLGDRWSTYQAIVADFLTGRATRQEFEDSLQPLITSTRHFIRHHNDIMLSLLTNSFRDPPPPTAQSLGWSKKRREHPGPRSARGDPAAKRLKTEVMGLTNRERARIKSIPKPDASYRLRPNSMIETRFAKLPRVPVTPQKINSSQHHIDIVRGFHAPLCTESHYLPDAATLKDRVLATCLENGLLGGLETSVPDLLISGLEVHLRNILTCTISKIRSNRPDCVSIPSHAPGPASVPSLPTTLASSRSTSASNTTGTTHSTGNTTTSPESTNTAATTMTTANATTATTTVIDPQELAFSYALAPHIHVEPCHPITRMVATKLVSDHYDDGDDDDEGAQTGAASTSSTSNGGLHGRSRAEEAPAAGAVSQRARIAVMLDALL